MLVDFKIEPALKTKQTSTLEASDTSLESSIKQMRDQYINGNPEK